MGCGGGFWGLMADLTGFGNLSGLESETKYYRFSGKCFTIVNLTGL